MINGKKILKVISGRSDIAIALLLMLVIFMMILPMPTAIVDLFISFNIATAVIILMLGVYIQSPLEFSAFPSVLLLTTLFRLALSITTTRLILLESDAGAIIQTFGEFVVGGNIIVGLVIFLIITIVQFIVITKGSERIAEVSARFTLDAMPGKQMSVDSDLRAGIITTTQARKKRSDVEKESQLFGSMDGALKFVKGDAIAGILITFVNLIGGVTIGVMQNSMNFSEAVALYSILTIGDGLVAQIPALIIAISAGIVVTRISDEKETNLGEDISGQFVGRPKAMIVAGGLLFIFALIPGFPYLIIGGLGIAFLTIGYFLNKKENEASKSAFSSDIPSLTRAGQPPVEIINNNKPASFSHMPVIVRLSNNLKLAFPVEDLSLEIDKLRMVIENEYGIPFPGVELFYEEALPDDHFEISISGIIESTGRLPNESMASSNILKENGALLTKGKASSAYDNTSSLTQFENLDEGSTSHILCKHICKSLLKHASEFIGIQETHYILKQYENSLGELIKEALRVTPAPKIANILRLLVADAIPISNMRTILEAIAQHGESASEPEDLLIFVRAQLKKTICNSLTDKNNTLHVILVEPNREQELQNALRQSSQGIALILDNASETRLIDKIKHLLAKNNTTRPIIITSQATRLGLSALLSSKKLPVTVLSDQEIYDAFPLNILGKV